MLYEKDDRVKDINIKKEEAIANASAVYDELMQENKNIRQQNEAYLSDYYNTNIDLANRQTEHNIGLINQQQAQAEKDYQKEAKNINTNYQKTTNRYGVDAEIRAQNGLSNTGYAENQKVNQFVKAQQQLSTIREKNEQAYQEFENQKSKARLENDSTIAQYGLEVMKQRLQYQLEEFQMNSELKLGKLDTINNLDQDYYTRYSDIVNQINWEKEFAENKRQYEEQFKYQKDQDKIRNKREQKYLDMQKKYG